MVVFVADTYALIELVLGNPSYKRFLESELVVTDFVLTEFYYYCLRYYGEVKAAELLEKHLPLRTRITPQTIELAGALRFTYKRENLSYTDCIGWALSNELGVPFLTGDKAFRDKQGVEFVS
jgi:predicted nucleic acid-binding protein